LPVSSGSGFCSLLPSWPTSFTPSLARSAPPWTRAAKCAWWNCILASLGLSSSLTPFMPLFGSFLKASLHFPSPWRLLLIRCLTSSTRCRASIPSLSPLALWPVTNCLSGRVHRYCCKQPRLVGLLEGWKGGQQGVLLGGAAFQLLC